MSEILPVLVADLLEESARDFLEQVARDNEEAWVPLVAAPVDTSRHVLEVYTPGAAEPLRLIAEPAGPPTEHGFPLRLSLLSDEAMESLRAPTVEEVAVGPEVTVESGPGPRGRAHALRNAGTARRQTPMHMSLEHSA